MTGTPYYVQLDQRCAAFEVFLAASPYLYGRLLLDTHNNLLNEQRQSQGVVHGITCKKMQA